MYLPDFDVRSGCLLASRPPVVLGVQLTSVDFGWGTSWFLIFCFSDDCCSALRGSTRLLCLPDGGRQGAQNGRIGSGRTGSVRVGSHRFGSGQVAPVRFGSGRTGSVRVG
ncbi:hypothetical protein ACJJTC_016584 [Scirpophaga incertulas]